MSEPDFSGAQQSQRGAGILFSDFGPYHVARIEALAAELSTHGVKLTAYRFSESSSTYGWIPVKPAGVDVVTLGTESSIGFLAAAKLAISFGQSVRQRKITTVFLPSYSPLPNTLCLLATRLVGAKAIMMNESWRGTEMTGFLGRICKKLIISLFNAALVGGRPQVEYAADYGIPETRIFTGYDVVDVDHFATLSGADHGIAPDLANLPWIPSRFFLNLGRFVEKKNLPMLVRAYATALERNGSKGISLVFVGEGPEQQAVETAARNLGLNVVHPLQLSEPPSEPCVAFYPFQQMDATPLFFAKSEALILPSIYEEWGLVVNEAMACGTPVIVSNKVGSSFDLVEHGRNGYTFDPGDVADLGGILDRFWADSTLRSKLGIAGSEIIQDWKPVRFGKQGFRALQSAHGKSPTGTRRVAFLVESLSVNAGGTALEVATLASELSQQASVEITVISCTTPGPWFDPGDAVRKVKLARVSSPWSWLVSVNRMKSLLADQDVVFVTGIWGPFDGLGVRWVWPKKARVFIRICGMLEPYILSRNRWKKIIGRLFWVDRNLRSAEGMITNSSPETQRLRHLNLGDHFHIMPNGVTRPAPVIRDRIEIRRRWDLTEESIVILYLGRIHPKKGLHLLLDALNEVMPEIQGPTPLQVLVAGGFSDDEYEAIIRAKLDSYQLWNTVKFCGEVSGDLKEEVFYCADLFILPSESEGLPNAVLEAMARNLPIILTEGCNIPEIAEYHAGKVVGFDASSLAAAIKWASLGETVLCEARRNARRLIDERFDLSTSVNRYLKMIRESPCCSRQK